MKLSDEVMSMLNEVAASFGSETQVRHERMCLAGEGACVPCARLRTLARHLAAARPEEVRRLETSTAAALVRATSAERLEAQRHREWLVEKGQRELLARQLSAAQARIQHLENIPAIAVPDATYGMAAWMGWLVSPEMDGVPDNYILRRPMVRKRMQVQRGAELAYPLFTVGMGRTFVNAFAQAHAVNPRPDTGGKEQCNVGPGA